MIEHWSGFDNYLNSRTKHASGDDSSMINIRIGSNTILKVKNAFMKLIVDEQRKRQFKKFPLSHLCMLLDYHNTQVCLRSIFSWENMVTSSSYKFISLISHPQVPSSIF
jgi:hypothetical protein